MRLDSFLIADHAVAAPDGKLYVNGGGITRLAVPRAGTVIPYLTIALRFLATPDDVGQHMFALRLQTPEGIHLFPPDARPIEVSPSNTVPDEEIYVQVVASFGGLPVVTTGTYTLSVELDGEVIREMKLPVVEVGVPDPSVASAT